MFFAPHPLYVQHMLRGISDFSLFFIHSHTITDWSPFKIQNTLLSQGPRESELDVLHPLVYTMYNRTNARNESQII